MQCAKHNDQINVVAVRLFGLATAEQRNSFLSLMVVNSPKVRIRAIPFSCLRELKNDSCKPIVANLVRSEFCSLCFVVRVPRVFCLVWEGCFNAISVGNRSSVACTVERSRGTQLESIFQSCCGLRRVFSSFVQEGKGFVKFQWLDVGVQM